MEARSKRLKNTTHVNVVFKSPFHEERLRDLLQWLNTQSVAPVSAEQLQTHLDELRRRQQGLDSLPEMAQKAGKELESFIPRLFVPSYNFAEFDLGIYRMILSVDLLNAGGELGFPEDVGSIIEIFWVGAKLPEKPETPEERDRCRQLTNERLRQLLKDLVRDFDVRFAFGGYVAFVSRYVAWLERSRSKIKPRRALPWELLWPLTYLPECELDEAALKALPVHFAERVGSGAIIQVFEDLVNGYEDRYREAAHALGLKSVWELRP